MWEFGNDIIHTNYVYYKKDDLGIFLYEDY